MTESPRPGAQTQQGSRQRERALMSIGEVMDRLRPDFPGVTISKIRFLEDQGLVEPERTPAGYRKFSAGDVERLRYVLTAQRDHYLPLKVIGEHLDAMDRGLEPPAMVSGSPQVPRLADAGSAEQVVAAPRGSLRLSRRELIDGACIDEAQLVQLETFGLVKAGSQGVYDADALLVAQVAGELAAYGVEPRHLRPFKTAADREVGLIEQVTSTVSRGRDVGAAGRAEEVMGQMASLFVRLHAGLVRTGLRGR